MEWTEVKGMMKRGFKAGMNPIRLQMGRDRGTVSPDVISRWYLGMRLDLGTVLLDSTSGRYLKTDPTIYPGQNCKSDITRHHNSQ